MALRKTIRDTTDLVVFYDGSSYHRDVAKLTNFAVNYGDENPISGDDLALILERPKEN